MQQQSDTLFWKFVSSSFWAAEFRHIWYCFLGPENYMRNRKKMSMAVTLVFLSSLKARHFQTMEWSHIWISKAHEISFSVISNNEIVGGMGFFRPHHDVSAWPSFWRGINSGRMFRTRSLFLSASIAHSASIYLYSTSQFRIFNFMFKSILEFWNPMGSIKIFFELLKQNNFEIWDLIKFQTWDLEIF